MSTPFHMRWGRRSTREKVSAPSEEGARFQELLRELFQFDCADLDFGIYRIMNHKREVIDWYIDRELPGAIEEAVGQGAIETEAKRADAFKEVQSSVIEAFGQDVIAPSGELLDYHETPLGKRYVLWRERALHAESAGDVPAGHLQPLVRVLQPILRRWRLRSEATRLLGASVCSSVQR